MSPTFWTVTFGIGVVQGAFLVVALFLRRSWNQRAAGALMAIVAVFTAMTLVELAEVTSEERASLLVTYLKTNVELVIGPLLLWFVRSLLDPDRRRSRRDALHFLPLLLGLAGWSLTWAVVEDRTRPFGVELGTVMTVFMLLKAAVFSAYVVAVFRTLLPVLRDPRGFSNGHRRVRMQWLAHWITGASAVAGLIYLSEFLNHQGVALPFEPDQLGALLLTATIYFVSLMMLLRPWFLSLRPQPAVTGAWTSDVEHLSAFLECRRPWLDSELGLEDLAAATGFTESRLSALINEGLSTSFYGLLGRYRLTEFERLARDPRLRESTVLELALRAGFNSKASFYRKFREAHGVTPSAYREALGQVSGSH